MVVVVAAVAEVAGAAVVVDELLLSSPPQAARSAPSSTRTAASRRRVRFMGGTIIRSSLLMHQQLSSLPVAATAAGTGPTHRRASASAGAPAEPTFAEHVCLALVVDGVSHGWALGTLLDPAGEIGRIWSLSRPLTYRAVEQLVAKGLLVRTGRDSGRGRDRVVLAASPTVAASPNGGSTSRSTTCATSAPSCWSS